MRAAARWALALALTVGCAPGPAARPPPAPQILVSTGPLRWMVEALATGEVAPIDPSGADPARWRPADDRLVAAQAAGLVVLNGAGLEGWAVYASLPPNRTVYAADAIRPAWRLRPRGVPHTHGPEGRPPEGAFVGEVWLDPALARRQAEAVAEALARAGRSVGPGLGPIGPALAALDRAVEAVPKGGVLLTARPAYAYLAARLKARTLAFELDPGMVPPETVAEIGATARQTGARLMLWPEAPAPTVEGALLGVGVASVVVPLGYDDPAWHRAYGEALGRLAAARRVGLRAP